MYRTNSLCDTMQNNLFNISKPQLLNDGKNVLSYVIVGYKTLLLKDILIKPYPFGALSYEKRTFNCRLSKARRIVETALETLANRFRVFLLSAQLEPKKYCCNLCIAQ